MPPPPIMSNQASEYRVGWNPDEFLDGNFTQPVLAADDSDDDITILTITKEETAVATSNNRDNVDDNEDIMIIEEVPLRIEPQALLPIQNHDAAIIAPKIEHLTSVANIPKNLNFVEPNQVLKYARSEAPKYIAGSNIEPPIYHIPIERYIEGRINRSKHAVYIYLKEPHDYFVIYVSPKKQVIADGPNLCKLDLTILDHFKQMTRLPKLSSVWFRYQERVDHGPLSAIFIASEFCRLAYINQPFKDVIYVAQTPMLPLGKVLHPYASEPMPKSSGYDIEFRCYSCNRRFDFLGPLRNHTSKCSHSSRLATKSKSLKPNSTKVSLTSFTPIHSRPQVTQASQVTNDKFSYEFECYRENTQIEPNRVINAVKTRTRFLFRSALHKKIPVVLFESGEINPSEKQIHILFLSNYYYVIYVAEGEQYIADGMNICFDLLPEFKKLTGLDKLRAVQFNYQTHVDHDASSAVVIAIEFVRIASLGAPVGRELICSQSSIDVLRNKYHPKPSRPLKNVGESLMNYRCSRCHESLSSLHRLRSHQVHCGRTNPLSLRSTVLAWKANKQLGTLYKKPNCLKDPFNILKIIQFRIDKTQARGKFHIKLCTGLICREQVGVHLYYRQDHPFIIYVDMKKQSYIADGTNKCFQDKVISVIRTSSGLEDLKPVAFHQQRFKDEEGISAIFIALEFLRRANYDENSGDELIIDTIALKCLCRKIAGARSQIVIEKCDQTYYCDKCGDSARSKAALANHKYVCYELSSKNYEFNIPLDSRSCSSKFNAPAKIRVKNEHRPVRRCIQSQIQKQDNNQLKAPIDTLSQANGPVEQANGPCELVKSSIKSYPLTTIRRYALNKSNGKNNFLNHQGIKIPIETYTSGFIDQSKEAIYVTAKKGHYYVIYVSPRQQIIADGLNLSAKDSVLIKFIRKTGLTQLRHASFNQQKCLGHSGSSAVYIAVEIRRFASFLEPIGQTIVTQEYFLGLLTKYMHREKTDPIAEQQLVDLTCVCGLMLGSDLDFHNHRNRCLKNRYESRINGATSLVDQTASISYDSSTDEDVVPMT